MVGPSHLGIRKLRPPPAWADAAGPLSEAIAAGERALAARRSLKLDPSALHFDERVLYFMYLRDGAELTPLCDRNSAQLYRYPLVEALAHEGRCCINRCTRDGVQNSAAGAV